MTTLRRSQQSAETREALLAAGRAVFARDGYHGASLDRVAAEAGFTKGAVYASFDTKANLLLAIYERRNLERARAMAAASKDVASLEELRRRLLAEWRTGLEQERGWALLRIEFWTHAARDPALRDRLRAAHLIVREALARALTDVAARAGESLPVPAQDLAAMVMALGNGLNLESFLDEPQGERLFDVGTSRLGTMSAVGT